ncbi:MAG: TIGR04282 family arsenosugar biosynthesis glycosyltransferase [Candidatus Brocadiales bacterium]
MVTAEDVLIAFVKYPEPGKVKTRLAKTVGAEVAACFYKVMAEDIVRRLKGCRQYKTIIFFNPPRRASDIKDWLGGDLSYIKQSGQDLGEKISNAFGVVFDSGARRAVVIGTDCLGITQGIITKTLRHLGENDVVIGPAQDGGYYLLGLSQYIPELFDSVDWSTDKVFQQTLDKAKRLNLSIAVLEPLKDVDEPTDISPDLLHLLKQQS